MMGIHIIKTPDIGEGIAEVELVAWNVSIGDLVSADQSLADVMTDKATVEIPAPCAGKVLWLGGKVGDFLPVGSELIHIEVEGEGSQRETPAAKTRAQPVAPKSAPAPANAALQKAEPAPPVVRSATRVPRKLGERPLASPAVRKQAWDLGIDLQYVAGSGSAGRITHEDLDAYAARESGGHFPESSRYARQDGEDAVPVIGLRRKIAQNMQESKRRIPHFTYVEELDVTELETLRKNLNAKWGSQRARLTLLPFLMRAMVLGVREFPQINARFDDEAGVVTRHAAVHIGIATQTAAGLLVSVLRHAETHDLWSGAAEVARLAEAARQGKAVREELSGSTITITSLGALGGIATTPVINHPEVAIVGVNRIVERPMIRNGMVVPRLMMNLSSSFDHRVVDGLHAAEFVQSLRGYLESPGTLFVE